MARETAAERRAKEDAAREAAYLASRVPATIADVRMVQITARGFHRDLGETREALVHKLDWLVRDLTRELDNLKNPAYDPSRSMLTGSLPHDIQALSEAYHVKARMLKGFVGALTREGVDVGVTMEDGQ